jgi:hypothetical protein
MVLFFSLLHGTEFCIWGFVLIPSAFMVPGQKSSMFDFLAFLHSRSTKKYIRMDRRRYTDVHIH